MTSYASILCCDSLNEHATMPPKRQMESQRNLDAFFASPAGKGKEKAEVKGKKLEVVKKSRTVKAEGSGNGNGKAGVKGKGKAKEEAVIDLDPETDDEVVCVDSPSPVPSSSKPSPIKAKPDLKPAINSKKSTQSEKLDEKPTARGLKRTRDTTPENASPLFVASTPNKRRSTTGQVLGLQSPHTKVKDEPLVKIDPSTTLPSTSTPTTKSLNFDTDPLTFRPEGVDTSGWKNCGGRLPYEVLVESVYLPVAGTRSRLAIGRVICK